MGAKKLDRVIQALTSRHRVLLLGGLAVIAHGHSRATKDADIWLEPLANGMLWAEAVLLAVRAVPESTVATLPDWSALQSAAEIATVAEEIGMVRILGLECPLDIFRRPNEIEEVDFDAICSRALLKEDGVYLPDPIDLALSKEDTGRDHDQQDQAFLISKARERFAPVAASASLPQVEALFARFYDHVICAAALRNPHAEVKNLGVRMLTSLAAEGDPFAQDVLESRSEG